MKLNELKPNPKRVKESKRIGRGTGSGFGKTSDLHTTSILQLPDDLPIVIAVIDSKDHIENVKPQPGDIIKEG